MFVFMCSCLPFSCILSFFYEMDVVSSSLQAAIMWFVCGTWALGSLCTSWLMPTRTWSTVSAGTRMAVLCAPSARTRLCVSSTREGAPSSRLFHIFCAMRAVKYKIRHYIMHEHILAVQCSSAGSFLITMLCCFHISHQSVIALS